MELNVVQNLMIIRDDLQRSIDNLKDDSTNEIIKATAQQEIDSLSKQIDYLHQYLKDIGQVMIGLDVPYWHEIKAKVDKND